MYKECKRILLARVKPLGVYEPTLDFCEATIEVEFGHIVGAISCQLRVDLVCMEQIRDDLTSCGDDVEVSRRPDLRVRYQEITVRQHSVRSGNTLVRDVLGLKISLSAQWYFEDALIAPIGGCDEQRRAVQGPPQLVRRTVPVLCEHRDVEVRVIDIGDVDLVSVGFVGYTIHLKVSNLGTIWRESRSG